MRGITIIRDNESIHTGNDLDLVQEVKEIGTPTVQSYTVAVPGRNGLLNLTKGLTGDVCYYNRSLSFQYFGTGSRADLLELVELFNSYQGESIKIIDDDTPDYYYEGEATVATKLASNYVNIVLTVNANPFRYNNVLSSRSVTLSSTKKTVAITNEGVAVVPTVIVTGSIATINKDNYTYTLTPGTYELINTEIKRGSNVFNVKGSGTITIQYREAKI